MLKNSNCRKPGNIWTYYFQKLFIYLNSIFAQCNLHNIVRISYICTKHSLLNKYYKRDMKHTHTWINSIFLSWTYGLTSWSLSLRYSSVDMCKLSIICWIVCCFAEEIYLSYNIRTYYIKCTFENEVHISNLPPGVAVKANILSWTGISISYKFKVSLMKPRKLYPQVIYQNIYNQINLERLGKKM